MDAPVYIADEIEVIVNKVDQKLYGGALADHIQYMHGHPLEIIKRLQEKSDSVKQKGKKYPLVALFQDFRIDRGARLDIYGTTQLNLIIANSTEPNYYTDDRYIKNFVPILYPIYMEFMNQLRIHPVFEFKSQDQIKHTLIERVYWGKAGLYGSDGNIFNDHLDCLEIQSLEITIRKKQNCSIF